MSWQPSPTRPRFGASSSSSSGSAVPVSSSLSSSSASHHVTPFPTVYGSPPRDPPSFSPQATAVDDRDGDEDDGSGAPGRAFTFEEQSRLRQDNFDLKLQLYNLRQKWDALPDDVRQAVEENALLKQQLAQKTSELQERTALLQRALETIEFLRRLQDQHEQQVRELEAARQSDVAELNALRERMHNFGSSDSGQQHQLLSWQDLQDTSSIPAELLLSTQGLPDDDGTEGVPSMKPLSPLQPPPKSPVKQTAPPAATSTTANNGTNGRKFDRKLFLSDSDDSDTVSLRNDDDDDTARVNGASSSAAAAKRKPAATTTTTTPAKKDNDESTTTSSRPRRTISSESKRSTAPAPTDSGSEDADQHQQHHRRKHTPSSTSKHRERDRYHDDERERGGSGYRRSFGPSGSDRGGGHYFHDDEDDRGWRPRGDRYATTTFVERDTRFYTPPARTARLEEIAPLSASTIIGHRYVAPPTTTTSVYSTPVSLVRSRVTDSTLMDRIVRLEVESAELRGQLKHQMIERGMAGL